MIILALDPARRTGFALGRPGRQPLLGVARLANKLDEPDDVFGRASAWINKILCGEILDEVPTLLAIEAPIAPAEVAGFTNFNTTRIALGLQGIFRGAARARGLRILPAPINSWRKYCLNSGNMRGAAAKAAMVRLCRQLGWGDDVPHDAAEAAGIFLWAESQIAPHLATRPEPIFSGASAA